LVPDFTGAPSLLGHGDDDADASDGYDHCYNCQNMGLVGKETEETYRT
jgi:hypothetical protein